MAHETSWTRVDLDDINASRGLGVDGEAISPENWTASYDTSYRQMATALGDGTAVIYDQANFLKSMRDTLRDIALANNARPFVVHLDVPAEVCISRWRANRYSGERYDVRDDDFTNVIDNFEAPGDDEDAITVSEADDTNRWCAEVLVPAIRKP